MDASTLQATPGPAALVIDDSPVECMLATAVLQKLGYSVDCVPSGEQALLLLAMRSFDLAICDISLPGMDGLALLGSIRACASPPPCIMLSAHDDEQHARAALHAGALAYLVKPLRLATMRDTLAVMFPQPPSAPGKPPLLRKLAVLLQGFSRHARRTAGATARPGRSAADGQRQAGIPATG